MATNGGEDPTRGSGADKVTEAAEPSFNAAPGANETEPSASGTPDPARGGCMKLGWGCLPVLAGIVLIPIQFF